MLKIVSQYNFWIGQVCLSLLQPRNSLFVAGSLPEQNQPRGEVSSLPHFGGETELAKPLFRCLCCSSKHVELHQTTKKGFELKVKTCSKEMPKGVMRELMCTKKVFTRLGFRPLTWVAQPSCGHHEVPNLMTYSSTDFFGDTIKWLEHVAFVRQKPKKKRRGRIGEASHPGPTLVARNPRSPSPKPSTRKIRYPTPPPVPRQQVSRTKCKFFLKDRCKKGDKCLFTHGAVEEPPTPPPKPTRAATSSRLPTPPRKRARVQTPQVFGSSGLPCGKDLWAKVCPDGRGDQEGLRCI